MATYAPSAAASDARSGDEGDASEHRRGGATTQTRARSDPRPARDCDRAPAPPAPPGPRHSACGADRGQAEGLAGLHSPPSKHMRAGPPADVVVFVNTGT